MPPVRRTGRAVRTAAVRTGPRFRRAQIRAAAQNKRPSTAPTRGKKDRVWRILASLHSTWGMGILE